MLKRGGIAVVDNLALIPLCYESCLMLQCVSVEQELNGASAWKRLTVLDKMTIWWLVELLISLAIKRAKPQVPATATRMLVILVRDYGDQRSVRTSSGAGKAYLHVALRFVESTMSRNRAITPLFTAITRLYRGP